jgi:hypothetical protein
MDSKTMNKIRLAAWNIYGLEKKLNDSYFLDKLNSFDIIVLVETWLSHNVNIGDFYTFNKYDSKERDTGRKFKLVEFQF